MLERRTLLGELERSDIPSTATEINSSNNVNGAFTGNVLYVPAYYYNRLNSKIIYFVSTGASNSLETIGDFECYNSDTMSTQYNSSILYSATAGILYLPGGTSNNRRAFVFGGPVSFPLNISSMNQINYTKHKDIKASPDDFRYIKVTFTSNVKVRQSVQNGTTITDVCPIYIDTE